jgi:hypothetical protein
VQHSPSDEKTATTVLKSRPILELTRRQFHLDWPYVYSLSRIIRRFHAWLTNNRPWILELEGAKKRRSECGPKSWRSWRRYYPFPGVWNFFGVLSVFLCNHWPSRLREGMGFFVFYSNIIFSWKKVNHRRQQSILGDKYREIESLRHGKSHQNLYHNIPHFGTVARVWARTRG